MVRPSSGRRDKISQPVWIFPPLIFERPQACQKRRPPPRLTPRPAHPRAEGLVKAPSRPTLSPGRGLRFPFICPLPTAHCLLPTATLERVSLNRS
jgi:hypothetical protein